MRYSKTFSSTSSCRIIPILSIGSMHAPSKVCGKPYVAARQIHQIDTVGSLVFDGFTSEIEREEDNCFQPVSFCINLSIKFLVTSVVMMLNINVDKRSSEVGNRRLLNWLPPSPNIEFSSTFSLPSWLCSGSPVGTGLVGPFVSHRYPKMPPLRSGCLFSPSCQRHSTSRNQFMCFCRATSTEWLRSRCTCYMLVHGSNKLWLRGWFSLLLQLESIIAGMMVCVLPILPVR